jgi:hypothetical protein
VAAASTPESHAFARVAADTMILDIVSGDRPFSYVVSPPTLVTLVSGDLAAGSAGGVWQYDLIATGSGDAAALWRSGLPTDIVTYTMDLGWLAAASPAAGPIAFELADDGYVVAWQDGEGASATLRAIRLGLDGVPGEPSTMAAPLDGGATEPALAWDGVDLVLATVVDNLDGGRSLHVGPVDLATLTVDLEAAVHVQDGLAGAPALATVGPGLFAIAFELELDDGTVEARAASVWLGATPIASAATTLGSNAAGGRSMPSVAAIDSRAAVAWLDAPRDGPEAVKVAILAVCE